MPSCIPKALNTTHAGRGISCVSVLAQLRLGGGHQTLCFSADSEAFGTISFRNGWQAHEERSSTIAERLAQVSRISLAKAVTASQLIKAHEDYIGAHGTMGFSESESLVCFLVHEGLVDLAKERIEHYLKHWSRMVGSPKEVRNWHERMLDKISQGAEQLKQKALGEFRILKADTLPTSSILHVHST